MSRTQQPLTPRKLYEYAKQHNLADVQIRICDGMAVSYYPTIGSLARTKDRAIIDVSNQQPVEFDELSANDQVIIYEDGRHRDPYEDQNVRTWIDAHAR